MTHFEIFHEYDQIFKVDNYEVTISVVNNFGYILKERAAEEIQQKIAFCLPYETKCVFGVGPCIAFAGLSVGPNGYPFIGDVDPTKFSKPIPIIDSSPFCVIGGGYEYLAQYHSNVKNFVKKEGIPFNIALSNHGANKLTIFYGTW